MDAVPVLTGCLVAAIVLCGVFACLWQSAEGDARYWRQDSRRWFDRYIEQCRWARERLGRPRRRRKGDPTDWWKRGEPPPEGR